METGKGGRELETCEMNLLWFRLRGRKVLNHYDVQMCVRQAERARMDQNSLAFWDEISGIELTDG
jgi:hypothetical protein